MTHTKLSLAYIKKCFLQEGYVALDMEYKNNKTKLNYMCKNKHKHSIKWNDWQQGHRCPHCTSQAKPTIEFIRKSFEEENYILISNDYKNNRTKLKYKCPEGHIHFVKWNNWKDNNSRCPTCAYAEHSKRFLGPQNPSWKGGISCAPYCQDWTKEYKEFIKERDGYKCLNPYCTKVNNSLVIHHIDYNKKNCLPSNLITLCNSCNIKANKDREWHEAWYKAILKKRNDY